MKKILTLLTFVGVLFMSNQAISQNSTYHWAVGYHVGSFQYNGDYGSQFFDFDPFRLFQRVTVSRYLNPHFDLELGGEWGTTGYYNDETESNSFKDGIKQVTGVVHYKFLGDTRLRPYLTAGLGATWFKPVDNYNGEKSTDFCVPLGLGLDYDIAPLATLSLQCIYGVNFGNTYDANTTDDKNDNWLNPSLGIKINFGKQDADGDGIADSKDLCPDVPGLAQFNGCPDTDGDGVQDSEDACPEIPGLVELRGCPDSDGDGIADKDDMCPNKAGLAKFNGCPDTDGDGVKDSDDECPTVAGTVKGCPDTDGDGIADKYDKCPNEAGLAKFSGCPDTDHDGFVDSEDECPTVAGTIKGCPDTDGDGISDKYDKCPNVFGVAANNGCPAVKEEVKAVLTNAMEGVYFDTNSAKIKKESYSVLNNVVKVMQDNPAYKLQIDGYTDNRGNDAFNLQLSKDRAKSVKEYLISKGVAANRLSSEGYGEKMPKATNDTAAGRAKNRRVEFTVNY
ncbi:MAG: thrombospondin type 3 repeat-containing protein [Saprospiraceae bacterium]